MNHNSLVLFTEPWNTQPANIAFHGSGCADLKQDPLKVSVRIVIIHCFSAIVMFQVINKTNYPDKAINSPIDKLNSFIQN